MKVSERMMNAEAPAARSRRAPLRWCGPHLARAVVAAVLTITLMARPAWADHDGGGSAEAGAFAMVLANILVGAAGATTLIGGSVSLGTDTPESPSHHLRGWSKANVSLGAIGLILTTVVAVNSGKSGWVFWGPIGALSAADLGLGIAGLLHEPAQPNALSWLPVPQVGIGPDDSLSMQLVVQGAW
jgi:hypothetical protein